MAESAFMPTKMAAGIASRGLPCQGGSDNPCYRRASLLSRSIGISGIGSLYACAAAELREIYSREIRPVLKG